MLEARLRELAPHPGEAVAAYGNGPCGAIPGWMAGIGSVEQIEGKTYVEAQERQVQTRPPDG